MPTVNIYTLSTCPWCRKAKRFFDEKGVPYDCVEYDMADDETRRRIREELDANNATGFPFVRIDGKVVCGYRPDLYRELLGLGEGE